MIERIKAVIDRFEEISRDREALFLREDDGETAGCASTGLLPTSHMVNQSAVFGRDEDKKKIIDFVLLGNGGGKNHISVVAIVGMGGVGKTTLAQLVYNDPLIRSSFDLSGWVYVSPQFDVTRVAKEVLQTISEKDYSVLTGLSAVQRAIVKQIEGKRLFLVLDDVWNELPDKWEQFMAPFQIAESVIILVTARDKAVAQMVQATYSYDLRCLPQDQCTLLFEHYAFGGQTIDGSSRLREISVQIVHKCAGLPLAIKCIGRALSCNMHEDNWRGVLESELWDSDGKDEIFPALKLSYYNLPPELKPCLLFCSLFPKGYQFSKDEIIYMWISHGYIQSRGSKNKEGVGAEFINELDRRSFLMLDKNRWAETFTLHDLIHDLAKSISMGQFSTHTWDDSIDGVITSEVHHVYVENCNVVDRSNGSIRTLIDNLDCQVSDLDSNLHTDMTRHYNLNLRTNTNLRVLKCHGVDAYNWEHLANLKHLCYFELVDDKLERLPKSTTLLFNLVALKICFLCDLKELPADIGKLVNLRFLSIDQVGIKELPESLNQLSNLQKLYLGYCPRMKELPICIGSLINLRELRISYASCTKLPESYCMLPKLQKLVLQECYNIQKLPDAIRNLSNLRHLYISCSSFRSLPESINLLHNLEVLDLHCARFGTLPRFLHIFKGLLNKCSFNISIDSMENKQPSNYSTSKSLLECLQPLNNMIKLKVNGYKGIEHPKWIFANFNSNMAIIMRRNLNNRNLFAEFGELPSLMSLVINQSRYEDPSHFKAIFPLLEEIESTDMLEWNLPSGEQDKDLLGLHRLNISNCPKLCSIPKFAFLRKLEIIKCSFSRLVLNKLHWQLLESIHIEECLQLTSLLGLHSLNSLQTLYVVRCPRLEEIESTDMLEWNLPSGEQDKDLLGLHFLNINNCPNLCSAPQFAFVRRLEIIKCSLSRLVLNKLHQQLLESLYIEECLQLTSLLGLHNLSSLRTLIVVRCPRLEEFAYPRKLNLPLSIEVAECPSLKRWCQRQQLNYIENLSCKMLATSGLQIIMKQGSLLLEHLVIEKCVDRSLVFHEGLCNLVTLEIKSCLKLETPKGLSELKELRRLVLWDCPLLQQEEVDNGDGSHLPPFLRSLVVHGCHRMLLLDLLQIKCPSLFTELEITNCKQLMNIRGLENLTILETLAIIQCPRLLQLGLLPIVPDCVVISRCPMLKAWCEIHSIEPLDEEMME